MHLMRTYLPAVGTGEGAAVLKRVLARRGCEVGAAREGDRAPAPGTRLFRAGEIIESDMVVAWILDEANPGFWDPELARELSAETGGFAVSVETSRLLGRAGCAVFFAGRTIEFVSQNRGQVPVAIGRAPHGTMHARAPECVYAAFAELYTRLTGWPYPEPAAWTGLKPLVATVCQVESPWRPLPDAERKLALTIFPLILADEFAAAWDRAAPAVAMDWRWWPAVTLPAGIPYVWLTREGDLDFALCEALAGQLDIPAAAVGLKAPGAPFDWWRAQPQQQGVGRGAESFGSCLMPAIAALGERPGIIRLR